MAFCIQNRNGGQSSPFFGAKFWLAAALIVVATIVAYLPAIRGGYIWDDDDYVLNNQTLRSVEGLRQIWFKPGATRQYYPLVHTSFWVEYHLWGLNALGYHAVNVALHAANAVLLWLVLAQLGLPGAWLAAAVFALHPVQVESVAWITERKNVLSCLFYFGAALVYFRSLEQKPARWYGLAFALFLCALLSKTVTASLPAALLLVLWWKRGRLQVRDVYSLLPFFIVGAVLGSLTAWMEKHSVGAEGEEWAFTALERVLIAGRALWFYAGKLAWPHPLSFMYPKWQIDARVWWQWLFPLSAIALVVVLWRLRERIGRGPVVAVLLFAGTLFPALGFFNVYPFRYSFVADHFQYHASIGLIVLFAAIAASMVRKYPVTVSARAVGCVVLLGVLGWRAWQQGKIYKDAETLWRDTIAKNPGCWLAIEHLGILTGEQGKFDEAQALFDRALTIAPNRALIHANIAASLARQGNIDGALSQFATALRLRPDYTMAHVNLAALLVGLKRYEEAEAHLQEAVKLSPRFAKAHYNLGVVLQAEGNTREAILHLSEAARLDPANTDAHYRLGLLLQSSGSIEQAIANYRQVLRLRPETPEALNQLAWILATRSSPQFRDGAEAVRLATRACELTGNREPALLDTLAAAHAETGDFEKATDLAQRAFELATAGRQEKLAAEIRARRRLYEQRKPFRETTTTSNDH